MSPEKLENTYLRSQFVAQVFVEGDPLKEYVVGVVVPDYDYLSAYAKTKMNLDTNLENLCKLKVRCRGFSHLGNLIADDIIFSFHSIKKEYQSTHNE